MMQAMRLLMLSLVLFLAFLQDSSPFVYNAPGQEVCMEDACEVEEEAVIQTTRQEQKKIQLPAEPLAANIRIEPVLIKSCYLSHRSFERHWLNCRKLRL